METLVKYEKIANNLLAVYNLTDWVFEWDNRAKRRLGMCDYNKKRISLSSTDIDRFKVYEVIDTMLHEVAHALTKGDGHGKAWKQKCIEIGANPEATYNQHAGKTFKGTCPTCGKVHIKNKPVGFCGDCYNKTYFTGIQIPYRFEWVLTETE